MVLTVFGCKSGLVEDLEIDDVAVGSGWANNSVNTVIFRQHAVTTYRGVQFTAYYDGESNLVLAKRKLPYGNWQKQITPYQGNTADAHNTISIAVDGDGYLHVSWDHHDNILRYAISQEPLSLQLGEKRPMTATEEHKVSYPQFYNLPNGNLLFFYRSGQSGRGTLVLNSYDTTSKKWKQLHQNLLDGEGQRNAYWQAYVDKQGTVHLSWVWRESWDASTNHDIAYAISKDGGVTWQRSNGETYQLPITAKTAEYAWKIPQNSSLINQTAMTADAQGNPYIVNYWDKDGLVQYQIVFRQNEKWVLENTGFRKSGFQLGGGGTKKIPISRPEIFINSRGSSNTMYMLFRDDDRGSRISLAYRQMGGATGWSVRDLTEYSVGAWEPNFDKELFKNTGELHIFEQKVEQVDGEGLAAQGTTPVKILEVAKLPEE